MKLFNDALRPIPLSEVTSSPLVSVLVANYNYAEYIGKAIDSVLGQTYWNFEIIICDDGSKDNSCKVVEKYMACDSRIKLIKKENNGQASALNSAYQESKGEIILILDADDCFTPNKIEKVVNKFRSNVDAGFIVHRMVLIDSNDNKGRGIPGVTQFENGWIAQKLIARGGRWRSMPASALCMKRSVSDLIFPIDEEVFKSVADAYIFTIAPLITLVDYIEDILAYYRLHGSNLTGSSQITCRSAKKAIAEIEKITNAVNIFLYKYTLSSLNIDVKDNLMYQEQVFVAKALDANAAATEIIKHYLLIARMLLKDDIFGKTQKIGGIVGYFLALAAPEKYRSHVLSAFLRPNRIKDIVRRISIQLN